MHMALTSRRFCGLSRLLKKITLLYVQESMNYNYLLLQESEVLIQIIISTSICGQSRKIFITFLIFYIVFFRVRHSIQIPFDKTRYVLYVLKRFLNDSCSETFFSHYDVRDANAVHVKIFLSYIFPKNDVMQIMLCD